MGNRRAMAFSVADMRKVMRVAKEEGVRVRYGYSATGEAWLEVDPNARPADEDASNPWDRT